MDAPQTVERVACLERDVAVCGREIGELKKKIDGQQAILLQLKDMNGNIMVLAEQVKQLATTTTKMEERLEVVESKPAKRWDTVVGAIVTGLIGIAIGWFVK